ncbi:MAG: aldo/keto reductase [Rikenellaceae bacterium]
MKYRYCGKSGLLMPELSLGLWHNFGEEDDYSKAKDIIWSAFDNGITQFDLANNYGPPAGAAELTFGRVLRDGLSAHRHQMIVTSKAGHLMWEGVYGDWASRKHIITSCDQSLKRMGLDYVDIFYSHRYDPNTPLEETMGALDFLVKSGRALYVGLSKYPVDKMREAVAILRELKTPVIVDQLRYSLLCREPEVAHFAANDELGLGCVSFSPLAQGQLTDRYLKGIPSDSRAAKESGFLQRAEVEQNHQRILELNQEALDQGMTLSEYAIKWQLTDQRITSVIIGVSRKEQLMQNLNVFK